MQLPKLEIVTGDVVNVQLTSETHVASGGRGKRGTLDVRSRVINRTRVFLKASDGRERDFSFANTTVGVREGHRVSIVLAKGPGMKAPAPVVLHNHATGQREELPAVLRASVRQRVIPARWRALGGAVILFLSYAGASSVINDGTVNVPLAILIGMCAYPVLWGVFAGVDAVVLPQRERALADRLHAEIEGRLKPLDMQAQAAAATTQRAS